MGTEGGRVDAHELIHLVLYDQKGVVWRINKIWANTRLCSLAAPAEKDIFMFSLRL